MNRRDLLKIAPLAALAPVATKIGNIDVQAHELKPGKKYVFVVRDAVPEDSITDCAEFARAHGIDGIWLAHPSGIEIFELEANGKLDATTGRSLSTPTT